MRQSNNPDLQSVEGRSSFITRTDGLWLLGYLGLAVIGIVYTLEHDFFWDGIQLGAKQAWWFYEKDFSTVWLPEAIDSGHPTFFPIYLAFTWTLFGPSLWISHCAMVPFILAVVFFSWRIAIHLKSDFPVAIYFPFLLFLDPTLLSQLLQLGPDVALMAFFMMGLYAVLAGKQYWKLVAVLGLGMISMRGMMCAFALFMFEFIVALRLKKDLWPWLLSAVCCYGPGVLLALTYLLLHFKAKGWFGYHQNSSWALSFEVVNGFGVLKNGVILGWRLLDFGRVFIWLGLFWFWFKRKKVEQKVNLVLLAIALLLVLGWPFIVYTGVSQHRYLLPFYIVLHLIFLISISQSAYSYRKKQGLFILFGLLLFSGNFWIYPKNIDQGWDSTLAHWPYHSLRKDATLFLAENEIPLTAVGTAFPAIGELKFRNPEDQGSGFKTYDIEEDEYIFFSNVINGFSDADQRILEQANWEVIFQKEKKGVKVHIYQKIN